MFFYDCGRIFFQESKLPSKFQIIKKLGVRQNSYAGNLVSRVYDYYFYGALNFKREYQLYYQKEFSSLERFIEEHFNIGYDKAITLAEGNYSMKEYSSKSFDKNIEIMNYDKEFKCAFVAAIEGEA